MAVHSFLIVIILQFPFLHFKLIFNLFAVILFIIRLIIASPKLKWDLFYSLIMIYLVEVSFCLLTCLVYKFYVNLFNKLFI